MCVRKLKHFQPHSLLCHLWCIFTLFVLCDIYICEYKKLTKQLRQTFFFHHIYNIFHIASQLYKHSCTSRTIASSQYHPRETRPLLGQPNLYKNCYIGITYYEFVSYITRNGSIYLLNHFFLFSYFFFLSFNFISNMKLGQSICWIIFIIQLFLFPFLQLHIEYEVESIYLLNHFYHSAISFTFHSTSYRI
jgi:hypothetical protein